MLHKRKQAYTPEDVHEFKLTRSCSIQFYYTIKYYEENLNFFQNSNRLIKNVDEITQEVIDGYVSMLMTKGDRITAINARLRAIFVFLRFCFNKGWAESYPLSQLKEDE